MVNYNLGKIYKIIDNTNENIYIGSTCEPTLARRLSKHVWSFKFYKEGGKTNFVTSFTIIENENYDIVLLENCICQSKDQLHTRERYYIESMKCVNKVIPTRTDKEYRESENVKLAQKEYWQSEKGKEIKRKKDKRYRLKHDDEVKKHKKEKFECKCGGKYTKCHEQEHYRTVKHQSYLTLELDGK